MRRWLAMALGAELLVALGSAAPSRAEPRLIPVPTQVIYPGDRISDALLAEAPEPPAGSLGAQGAILQRSELVGKVARRTLLPGKPIPINGVEEPRAVSVGALVKIVYAEDGIKLTTVAQALQNGFVGQIVQLRNLDSGIVVTGAIQPDGSVHISGD